MLAQAKNGNQVFLKQLHFEDFEKLLTYLHSLSTLTKKQFEPHSFNIETLNRIFTNNNEYKGFIAIHTDSKEILGYFILKFGYLDFEFERLKHYNIDFSQNNICTFAPSVADDWQSQGIGKLLFEFALAEVKNIGIKQVLLWGGVQADNIKAITFYSKLGFEELGRFEYNGLNIDMKLDIS